MEKEWREGDGEGMEGEVGEEYPIRNEGDHSNLRGEASKPNHPHKVAYRTDGSSLSCEMTC